MKFVEVDEIKVCSNCLIGKANVSKEMTKN